MLIGLNQMFIIKDKWREGSSDLRRKDEENCHCCESWNKTIYITLMQLPMVWHSCDDAHEWASAIPVWWEKSPVSGVTNQVAGCLGWTLEESICLWNNMGFLASRRSSVTLWNVWLWQWRRSCTSVRCLWRQSWRSTSNTKMSTLLSRKER